MKCILYISKINHRAQGPVVPQGLLDIYNLAKKRNHQFGITGILAFKAGHYLQVIEGNGSDVDNLYRNILQDDRHRDVATLVDCNEWGRVFSNWSFKSNGDLAKDTGFHKFIDQHSGRIAKLSEPQKHLLSIFYKPRTEVQESSRMSFEGRSMRLSRWPDLDASTPSAPECANLCAMLLYKPCNYSDLLSSLRAMEQSELDDLLTDCMQQGVLKLSLPENSVPHEAVKQHTGFYQKMRDFLTLH